MEFSVRVIDIEILPAFHPYLLPQVEQQMLSGEEGLIALGAVSGQSTCGAIAGELEGGSLTILSLYVDEQVRRMGVGRLLLHALLEQTGARRVDASWILPDNDFYGVDQFFQKNKFAPAENGEIISRITSETLKKVPALRRAFSPDYRPDANVVPVREFTVEEREELERDPEIKSFLQLYNFADEELDGPLCLGYRYNGRICAYFIGTFCGEREVALRAALAREGAPPAAFLQLISAAAHSCVRMEGEPFVCWFSAITPSALHLAERLSGGDLDQWREGKTRLLP